MSQGVYQRASHRGVSPLCWENPPAEPPAEVCMRWQGVQHFLEAGISGTEKVLERHSGLTPSIPVVWSGAVLRCCNSPPRRSQNWLPVRVRVCKCLLL